jgi:glycosyltransferase involved in cell wall biosynthesis
MDSCLEALEAKGNLAEAPSLYNPGRVAERVLHFTPCPADVRFAPRFAEWSVEIVPYLRRRESRRNPLAYPGALARIYRTMRRARVDLVRGRLPYVGSLLGILAGRALRIPTVVSLGGDNRLGQERTGEYYFGSRAVSYRVEEAVLRLADALIVPNRFTLDYVAGLIGRARTEAKTTVIPWRVDPPLAGRVAPEALLGRLALLPSRPLLLVAGFLNRYKHTDVMFDLAAALCADPAFDGHVAFCGDGPMRADGERRFAQQPGVRFLGWLPRDELRQLIRCAAAVLVPMSGFVLLEAAAEGRPVVAARLEWHGELVEPGETGLLVPATSVSAWHEAVMQLLGSRERAAALGAALQRRFRDAYDPEIAVRREVALYRALAAGAHRGGDVA